MVHRMQNDYFRELTINLQHENFAVCSAKSEFLPVEWDSQPLCRITASGGIRYREEDTDSDSRSAALDKVISITRATTEYMRQMETAPKLTASGLEGDYRLLADFNNIVLAGHPTQYGVQFITWERVQNRTALYQGNYYGPSVGIDGYAAAKRNFATRSGLIPHSALFAPEQLAEIYRCIHETLGSSYPITDERQKCLESAIKQIQDTVPDLDERAAISNTEELEFADMIYAQNTGMQFQ